MIAPATIPKDTATTEYIERPDGSVEVRRRDKGERTLAEKRAALDCHRDRCADALDALSTAEGIAAYLYAGELIQAAGERRGKVYVPSAGNVALVAWQAPGQLVQRYAGWKRDNMMRKGLTADVWLTGGKGYPVANWSGDSVGADRYSLPTVDRLTCEGLAESWRAWPDHSLQGVKAWAADIEPGFIEAAGREGITVADIEDSRRGDTSADPADLF